MIIKRKANIHKMFAGKDINGLVFVLLTDTDQEHLHKAACAIVKLNQIDAASKILNQIGKAPERNRQWAAYTLTYLCQNADDLDPFLFRRVVAGFIKLLEDNNDRTRKHAEEGLRLIARGLDTEKNKALVRQLMDGYRSPSTEVRRVVLQRLSSILAVKNPYVFNVVRARLQTASFPQEFITRFESLDPLSKPQQKQERLIEGLVNPDLYIRQEFIFEVMKGGKNELYAVEEAVKRLIGKEDIQFYTPYSIRMLTPSEARRMLLKLAQDKFLLCNPEYVQALFERVDIGYQTNELNREMMQLLDQKSYAVYQLLVVHLTLKKRLYGVLSQAER